MKGKKKWLLLGLLLLCFSVVYAMLITKLNIGGNGKLSKNEWNIIFENILIKDGSVDGSAEIVDDTSVSFNANLDKPGDYFEFSVDVSNKGTLDALVDNFVIGNLGDNSTLVDYDVRYNDGMDLGVGDKLLSKEKDTLLVRVAYRTDISVEDLNTEEVELNFEFDIDYVQDLGTGIVRKNSLNRLLINNVKESDNINYGIEVTESDNGIYNINGNKVLRGTSFNNNVVIDNVCYQAVMTDSNDNVKLLYNGTYVDGKCNGTDSHIGLSKFSDEQVTYKDSVLRTKVLEWYEDNVSKYDDHIVAGYYDGTAAVNKYMFDFGNLRDNQDSYIEDKVGLLSMSDVMMIGYGSESYLNTGYAYYTMSIYRDEDAISIDGSGNKVRDVVGSEFAVRPVIIIEANSHVSSGDGSQENPYIVNLEV